MNSNLFNILKILKYYFCIFLFIMVTKIYSQEVFYKGSIQSVKSRDYSAKVILEDFANKKNLYALGPVENLDGEITIMNGKYYISSVNNNQLITINSNEKKAIFLVWSEVKEWKKATNLNKKVINIKEFQDELEKLAINSKIDLDKPFVFKVTGIIDSINYHILSPIPLNKPNSSHRDSSKNIFKENMKGDIIGFYSKKHEGIFTHHGSFIHFHVVDDSGHTGHIDNITLNKNVSIYFPEF